MPASPTPQRIQEQLRKDTLYGCALCGCPILEYVHITPHPDIQAFLPENMVLSVLSIVLSMIIKK